MSILVNKDYDVTAPLFSFHSSKISLMLAKRHLIWRRKIRQWIDRLTLISIVLFTCFYIYAAKIEPNWIEIVPVQLAISNLDQAFDEFKIVQISDLHFNKYMPKERMARIVRLVNQQQPDAIAITGDIITRRKYFDGAQLKATLSQLQSKSAVLAVLGNHDHWMNKIEELKDVLRESEITCLDNQVYVVERQGKKLAFAGLDDPYWGYPELEKTIAQLPEGFPAILLVHEPDYIEQSAKTHKFVLQLSGHSHGGQIKIPFLDPFILPHGGEKYFAGLERVEETIAYTNRGLGMTNIPVRFGSRPEITVFTLRSSA